MANRSINRNVSYTSSFKLEIPGLEEYNYFVQMAPLPGMNMASVEAPYMNNATNVPSNRVEYDQLNITFLVAEDYSNHSQIRLWMHRFVNGRNPIYEECKDIVLHVLNSNKVPTSSFKFYRAYPTLLGEIQLESGVSDAMPALCNVSFRYQYYDSIPIG